MRFDHDERVRAPQPQQRTISHCAHVASRISAKATASRKKGYHVTFLHISYTPQPRPYAFIASTNSSLIPFSSTASSLVSFTRSSTLSTFSLSSFGRQCLTS